jgi:PPOX class probable F420-dependent enzyme
MAELSEAERVFIADNPFYAVVTTLRHDGSPLSTVVWVDEEDGQVVFNTARGRAKEGHLSRDGRASVLVLDPGNAYRWVSVSGPVELSEQGADEVIDALSRKYTGSDYAHRRPGEIRVTARLKPEHVTSVGLD